MIPRASSLSWLALYGALAVAIAGPLLASGYVFALDHAMGPQSAAFYSRYIVYNDDPIQSKGSYAIILGVLSAVGPAWVGQKLILFVPFALAGFGAHRLVASRSSSAGAVFAGFLYAASPFAYIRGVSGQTGVLWAYALAPWFLHAWLLYTAKGDRRALAASVFLVAATIVFQAHGAALLAILVIALATARLLSVPSEWRSTIRAPLMLAAWSLVVNAYWLVPVALAPETTLTRIGEGDRAFFATTRSGLPSVGFAALTLQGFWRASYASPYAHAWLLVAPALVVFFCAYALATRKEADARGVALAGALAFLLAIGGSSRWTAWLFDALWDAVPPMRGFRDAHKFLALLALAYAYLAPTGLDAIVEALRRSRPRRVAAAPLVAFGLALLVPLASATPLLGGYAGQLGATPYPEEWAEAEVLTRDCDGAMVVLPWHLYMDVAWIPNKDKRVTGPAKLYFSCPTFSSDDIELGAATSQASSPQSDYVAHWVASASLAGRDAKEINVLGGLLAPARVRYVLLLKESDHLAIQPTLDAQSDLRLVLDNARLRLYENEAPIAPALHGIEDVRTLRDRDELIAMGDMRPLAFTAFSMDNTTQGSVHSVYTPDPRARVTGWRLDGEEPAFHSLGFAPAFEGDAAGDLRDVGAAMGAAAWVVSVAGASAFVWWSRRKRAP